MNNSISANNQKLVKDIKSVVADAEAILSATADQTSKEVTALRSNMTAKLADAKQLLLETEQSLLDRTRQAASFTNDYVRENPWQSIAIASGVGFLIRNLPVSRIGLTAVTVAGWWLSLNKPVAPSSHS
jgi:ElaB/YqjD/DUF883 family membrane-anchored ribosome-binding protein